MHRCPSLRKRCLVSTNTCSIHGRWGQIVGSLVASIAAMMVENFQLDESNGNVGRNVAAALFLISGFWAMIVFFIWQSAVNRDIEDELKDW